MDGTKKMNGRTIVDYMARDYDSLLRSMRNLIPGKLPEWKDYESEADFGNVLLQLFAHMGDILSYYQDRVANESFLGTAQTRRSIIQHLRLIGYTLSSAAPASTELTLTVPADCDKTVTISKGDAFATKSQKDKPSVRFEYTREEDLTIDCNTLPVAVKLATNKEYKICGSLPAGGGWDVKVDPATNQKYKLRKGVSVEEGRLVEDEILGTSDGTANQRFPLVHPRLILRSLGQGQDINTDIVLVTRLGDKIDKWKLQETLAFSRDEQKDYIIDIDEEDQATVIFGDGAFGAIPPVGAVIKATYRAGGGSHGNVSKDSITTIVDAPQLALLSAKVTNPDPATGGADRESIEHAVMHAPHAFRSRKRAVTAEDYRSLALGLKGVGKVRAEAAGFNTVKLFVAPEGGGYLSDVLKANLLAYFEDKRPVATIIEIEDVDYIDVYVTAKVEVERYYSRDDIKEKVINAAGSLLAFDNVDFAQTIYLSKFYEAIEAIDGVRGVNIKEFRRKESKSGKIADEGKIKLGDNEIPQIPEDPDYAGGIKVIAEGGI
ncbi:MAG: baseplate J/gp47 family protein [Planctomycetota bacterium]|jgi:hypothetical protein